MSATLGPSARFFFYGTLLDPDIQRRVIGRAFEMQPAALHGFRRVRAAGKWYPMLVPGLAADAADGAVVQGLNRAELARMVEYEGANYALRRVTARLTGGATQRALVFLPLAGVPGALRPSAESWDLAEWQEREKPRVMRLKLWP